MTAKRFMAWGKFDKFITGALPAKELRALIRVKGVAGASDQYKAILLRRKSQEELEPALKVSRSGAALP
jgi:hypothetical protein